MSDATLPLMFVEREARSSVEDPPLLILLHGFGASEHDLIGLADELPPEFHVVSARAPIDLADAGMPGGFAWFNLIFRPDGIAYDEDSAEEGAALARAFVRAARERVGVPADRTFLLGFSQGAMMAHSILLGQSELLGGAACCSGRAVDRLFQSDRDWSGLEGFPLFVSHGLYDDVIPIAKGGHAIRDYYERSPVDLTYVEEPVAHGIGPLTLAGLQQWLARFVRGE